MNRAYLDLVDVENVNAVLLYLPDNPTPANNFLATKFPEGYYTDKKQIWAKAYQHINGNKLTVWFEEDIYSHNDLIVDLRLLGYNVIQLDKNFNQFPKMQKYIEENQL